jgi:hypothetical protein
MPRDTAAVRALKTALAQATTPAEQVDIAAKLARAQHQQGIERGRRRRANAAKPPKPPEPQRDDSSDEFRLCECPVGVPCTCPPPAPPPPLPKPAPVVAAVPAPKPVVIEPEPPDPRTQNNFATTRVIAALNAPGARYFDPIDRIMREDYDPRSSVGPSADGSWIFDSATAPLFTDTFSDGQWQSERDKEEKEAEKPIDYDERCRRAAAAAAAGRWR